MRRTRTGRLLRTVASTLVLLLVLVVAGFLLWAHTPHRAEPEALGEAARDFAVEVVDTGDAVVVEPADTRPGTGVVFYPGARVSPDAYVAPWAPIAAEHAVRVVIPAMPSNLAVLDTDRADEAIAEHGAGIGEWYVGGHSLGGAMAASYTGGDGGGTVRGLVLWGSYATGGADLSGREGLRVVSVSGGRDGLADPATIDENRRHLPPDALMHEIGGMSHAQFGAYGDQRGDGTPLISDAEAHRELAEVTGDFLSRS